eukprot:TRINITY_DN66501_c0_g1_i1.p1 TRINITY_DN66501_c0_g1~~TRINITY_DN66501_c0_g1_i1.p1  ORF type:complete len:435 (+),score=180.93 TRINITY_DN66501_c0_g1_i1:77-1306(+)
MADLSAVAGVPLPASPEGSPQGPSPRPGGVYQQGGATEVAAPGSCEEPAGQPEVPGVQWEPPAEQQRQGLSCPSISFLLIMGVLTIFLLFAIGWRFLIVLPLLYAPTAVLFWRGMTRYGHLTTPEFLVRRYMLGVVYAPLIFVVQFILQIIPVMVLFRIGGAVADEYSGSSSASREDYVQRNPTFILTLLVFLFVSGVLWALPEELLKYYVAKLRFNTWGDSTSHLLGSMAVACGYATTQSFALVTIEDLITPTQKSFVELLVAVVLTALFLMPLHLLSAYIIGLRLAWLKEHENQGQAALPDATGTCRMVLPVPLMLRSVFYWVYTSAMVFTWVHPIFNGIAVLAALIVVVRALFYARQLEMAMPPSYLGRVGYMHAFGYGVLPQVQQWEEQEGEDPQGAAELQDPAG